VSKRRFVTKAEAVLAIGEKRLGVYACPLCAGYHLTSQTVIQAAEKAALMPREEKPSFDTSLLARAKWIDGDRP
jgi:hypothetical protein